MATSSMSQPPSLVHINSADLQTIESLPGVGPVLAARILQKRLEIGAFRTPRDLLLIEGMSKRLVTSLVPLLDWRVQETSTINLKPEWTGSAVMLLAVYYALQSSARSAEALALDSGSHFDIAGAIAQIWFGAVFVLLSFYMLRFMLSDGEQSLKHFPTTAKALSGILIATLPSILVLAYGYTFLFGWRNFPTVEAHLRQALVFMLFAMLLLPFLLIHRFPKLSKSRTLERIHMTLEFLFNLLSALGAFSIASRETTDLLTLAVCGIVGVYNLKVSVDAFRGKSTFSQFLELLDSTRARGERHLDFWLQNVLPNPSDQLELKEHLEAKYSSRLPMKTFAVVMAAVGFWTVTTVVAGVIQWAIGKGLDRHFQLGT